MSRGIRFAIVLVVLIHAGLAFALAPGSVSVTMTSDPLLVLDSNNPCVQGPDASYVAFQITNTSGGPLTGLSASLGVSGTGYSLGGGQAASQYVGNLATGASKVLFWFIQYSCTIGATGTLTVTVSDANAGTNTGMGTVTTNSTLSANAGGQVTATTLGPGAIVGQIITMDIQYSFGGTAAGDFIDLQPAGNTAFNAGCFQLVGTQITASAVTQIPATAASDNQIYFGPAAANQPGTGHTVTVRYFFKYLCAGVNTVADPFAAQTSGSSNRKYTGNFGQAGTVITFPTASNTFTIAKMANPSMTTMLGQTITYTVTIANTSPTLSGTIDSLSDTLPAGATYVGLDGTSDVTLANSSSVPPGGASGTISWNGNPGNPGTYVVPANGSIKLVYQVTLPNSTGSFMNSVTAVTGSTSIGPATSTVGVTPVELQRFEVE